MRKTRCCYSRHCNAVSARVDEIRSKGVTAYASNERSFRWRQTKSESNTGRPTARYTEYAFFEFPAENVNLSPRAGSAPLRRHPSSGRKQGHKVNDARAALRAIAQTRQRRRVARPGNVSGVRRSDEEDARDAPPSLHAARRSHRSDHPEPPRRRNVQEQPPGTTRRAPDGARITGMRMDARGAHSF
ncbi:hypothetical protein HPB51_021735 [Rhipicephalus microplus]|uniref:Uncharacterized protein n=1 Tax=Rhipicephalus microplus TaxID=6941 RepID=A0A9J6DQH7_RHIMP|nr:hypothetical protein HPB51_021735 [Rhipicephalus microplus]